MKFNITVEELRLGSVISKGDCERILGVSLSADSSKDHLLLVQLSKHLSKIAARVGNRWTFKIEKGEIHVLAGDRASQYNQTQFRSYQRRMRKHHQQLLAVDVVSLSGEARIEHDEAICRQSRILQGMKQGRKPIATTPYVRDIPKMF